MFDKITSSNIWLYNYVSCSGLWAACCISSYLLLGTGISNLSFNFESESGPEPKFRIDLMSDLDLDYGFEHNFWNQVQIPYPDSCMITACHLELMHEGFVYAHQEWLRVYRLRVQTRAVYCLKCTNLTWRATTNWNLCLLELQQSGFTYVTLWCSWLNIVTLL